MTAEDVKRGNGSVMPTWEGAIDVMLLENLRDSRVCVSFGLSKQRCSSGLKGAKDSGVGAGGAFARGYTELCNGAWSYAIGVRAG